MINFLVTLAVRWSGLACSLISDACAAYSREGLRAAFFEVGVRARVLHTLTLGSPIIFGEMLRTTRETEGLRAAWRAGEPTEDYVRRRCAEVGVSVGSPTHNVVLVWATEVVNWWEWSAPLVERRPREERQPGEVWSERIPG
jgi:hypothetical protein